jgi:hypothetical protein
VSKSKITRRVRAWWHRRELAWLLDYLGCANLDQLDAFLARPVGPALERWIATRERIMMQRDPMKLVREAIETERANRVIEAVLGGG